ncbi:MAG: SbcC/MukB-like Walker B domain-containing protein [Eubacteriales bacterium]
MKQLNRVLLINWLHYDHTLVDLKQVNFFTGNNGSGKSAFLDALQVVLLGETKSSNFNKAANDRSERTLEGYLRADRSENSPRSRRGKDFCSYLVCEFYDQQKDNYFVLGAVFECYQNGEIHKRFFLYDGTIPDHQFLEQKIAMDIDKLKKFLKSTDPDGILTEKQSTYREHMMARTNVYDPKFFSLLKKSIALKEVRKIEDFITENLCDVPPPPDIYEMQENIRNYKDQERMAEREAEKLQDLVEICKTFDQVTNIRGVLTQHEFLVLWGEQELLRQTVSQLERELQQLHDKSSQLDNTLATVQEQITSADQTRQSLCYQRDNSDEVKEQQRLEALLSALVTQANKLKTQLDHSLAELRTEANWVVEFCQSILRSSTTFESLCAQAEEVKGCYDQLCAPDSSYFGEKSQLFEGAHQKTVPFCKLLQEISADTRQRRKQLQTELEQIQIAIQSLQKNIKRYPVGLVELRDRLRAELQTQNPTCEVEILADLLELTTGEEGWRAPIEAYLNTQKFYLLVSPECYGQAISLFDDWKKGFSEQSFGLVDLEKLRKKGGTTPHDRSLAHKIQTENPLGRAYIDYLLGRVVACQTPEELRGHTVAVTQSGLVYQGYVLRNFPQKLLQSAYIGKKAIELQLKQMQNQQERLLAEQTQLTSQCAPFEHEIHREWLIKERYLKQDLTERAQDHLDYLENSEEQASTQQALSKCDLFWLGELQQKIEGLEGEIAKLSRQKETNLVEIGGVRGKIGHLEGEQLPQKRRDLTNQENMVTQKITPQFRDEIGLPRYVDELARLGEIQTLITNFKRESIGQNTRLENQKNTLLQQRFAYSQKYQTSAYSDDTEENTLYESEKITLEESKLPQYAQKIKEARESAMEQFQNEFLDKLKSNIDQVRSQLRDLNRALKGTQFGSDSYQFKVEPDPSYLPYYKMITSDKRMEGDVGFFRTDFDNEFADLREEMFLQLSQAEGNGGADLEKNIKRYTDYRTYLKFDMESTDKHGIKQLLSKVLATNSGGETQTPFYVAMLASYAQLYKVNDITSTGNTMRLVIFDEAFSKMDSDRIIESVGLIRTLKLQAIMCTPPEKVADIMPEVDQTILFTHQNFHMNTLPFQKEHEI